MASDSLEEASMKDLLSQMLGNISKKDFVEMHYHSTPFSSPQGARALEGFLSWSLLDEIFRSGHTDCWLVKNGRLLPPTDSTRAGSLTLEEAQKGFLQGQTVLVRHAEKAHPRVRALAADFAESFGDPDVQIYATPPNEEGFDWHFDIEDVFVIQCDGVKEFLLRKNTLEPWPVSTASCAGFHRELSFLQMSCQLKAGDWLYIPAGYWHKARALTESWHLSVGLMSATALDFYRHLEPQLAASALWRKRWPVRGTANPRSADEVQALRRQTLQELARHLTELVQDESQLEEFFKRRTPLNKNPDAV